MDFEKFIEEVKSRIKDFLPEKYADAEIYVHEQKKINSQYTGLTVVGKNIANPLATILSAALMFEYAFELPEEGAFIRKAVAASMDAGVVTSDIANNETPSSTTEVGEWIVNYILK